MINDQFSQSSMSFFFSEWRRKRGEAEKQRLKLQHVAHGSEEIAELLKQQREKRDRGTFFTKVFNFKSHRISFSSHRPQI
jgi:uncharacterized protein YhaN